MLFMERQGQKQLIAMSILYSPLCLLRRPVRLGSLLIACLLIAGLSGCSLKSGPSGPGASASGIAIRNTALSTVGTPYVLGGTSPSRGFDCSGLVVWSYAKHGLQVPRTAREQSRVGKAVGKNALQEGDIVVFNTRSGAHTGIYTGRGKFVHSPRRGKNVSEETISSKYWSRCFVAGRRHEGLR